MSGSPTKVAQTARAITSTLVTAFASRQTDQGGFDIFVTKFIGCCITPRGDVNSDGNNANILDLTYLVDRIFRGGPPALCPKEADVNSDGNTSNILDLTFLVDRIFRGGPAPGPCL